MTYRSPEEALRERNAALEAELAQLEEKQKSASELEADITRVVEALAKSRTLLDRLEKKRALPMLDRVRVASPCTARWDTMTGDDKVRFCGACQKNVFNLSAMTREEAEVVMLEKDGELCVRLYRRADGTVLTRDCPVGAGRRRLRLLGVMALGGSALAAAAGFAAATLSSRAATEPVGDRAPAPVTAPELSTHLLGAAEVEVEVEEPEPVEMGKMAPAPPSASPKRK